MDTARVGQVRAYQGDGVVNHILLRSGEFDSRNLLITWTVVSPRGQQRGHAHVGSEQAYIFIHGKGRIRVEEEVQYVGQGQMVYVPPGRHHSVVNTGDESLVYITIASPPFPVERLFAESGQGQAQRELVEDVETG